MNTLYKSPRGNNKFSGNVCISYEELDQIKNGHYTLLKVEGRNFNFTKNIESWMLENVSYQEDYVLFPYSEKSLLIKGRYQD